MSEQAEGWHTDASGLRVKKWDPHRETRRRGYERQLQQHQARRLEGAPPSSSAAPQPAPGQLAPCASGGAAAAPRRPGGAWLACALPNQARFFRCSQRVCFNREGSEGVQRGLEALMGGLGVIKDR